MAKVSWIQNSFNAGELSPKLKGRSDLEKYKNGCETLENFIPQIYGPITKRPGTRFVREVKDSSKITKLFSFQYSINQAYILEFGDNYIRFFKDGGIILDGASPYEIVSPYGENDLNDLQITQSADIMYIVHPDYPPYELLRYDETDWVIQELDLAWPVFDDENTDSDITLIASALTGTITLTASEAIFTADDVGSYIKISEAVSNYRLWVPDDVTDIHTGDYLYYLDNLYRAEEENGRTGTSPPLHTDGTQNDDFTDFLFFNSGSGYVKITAFTSTTVVTAVVQSPKDVDTYLPPVALTGTKRWARSAWSDSKGYPRTVCFYEDRLWFAGSTSNPQTLWGSVSGDYKNFFYGTNDDEAVSYTINSQQVDTILWMTPGKILAIGTSGGEFVVSASSLNEAITPSNIRIVPQTTYGSVSIQPYKIGGSVLFVQRASRKIRELTYQFENDSYVAPNLTILAEHVGSNGFVDMTYQQEPDQIVWVIDSEGNLFGLTYERVEDVVGWHRHNIGGSVTSLSAIPHWDGDQDVVWMIVSRTINGATVQYIEYMEKIFTDNYSFYVDCGLTYDGSPATTISGLDHLEGETVSVITDGSVHPNCVVTSGEITLQVASSVVNIGLSYTSTVKTMPIEAGAADGTAQGKTARINNITFRLYETAPGLWYGPCTSCMDELQFRTTTMDMDEAVPLFSGDTAYLPWPGEYEQGVQIEVQHRIPLPCTIISLMPQMHTYDR